MKIKYNLCLVVLITTIIACNTKNNAPKKIKQVLIFGNSIVGHGPAPQIGWNGAWGMAASVIDSDFVHLLASQIKSTDSTIGVQWNNIAQIEVDASKFDFSQLDTFVKPDMLILRFGENVDDGIVTNGNFTNGCSQVIDRLDPKHEAVIVIVNGIWHNPRTNRLLEEYAQKYDYIFVKNDDLLNDSTNFAYGQFTDPGVAKHPSDIGMRRIKDRIWEQIKLYFKK